MKRKIADILGGGWLMAALLLLYGVALGVATFVENSYSTALAREWFYNSIWFAVLQGMLCVNFVVMAYRLKLWHQKKWGVLMLHYGFVAILIGAMTSHITAKEGIVHLRVGESSAQIIDEKGAPIESLPFSIALTKFEITRYGGSGSPQSFQSDVVVEGKNYHIYMNNVLSYGGWRFYQSSFDNDEQGSYLLASSDGVGTAITYVGYILLALGMVLSLCHKNSRFRRLLSSLSVLFIAVSAYGARDGVSERFERLMVQTPDGRVQAVSSYANDILRKINRQQSYNGMTASEVLLGITTDPVEWSREKFVKDDAGNLVAFVDVIGADGKYLLSDTVDKIYKKTPRERTKSDKEILKFDERINILDNLFTERMLAIFPLQGSQKWYSAGDDLSIFAADRRDSMLVNKIFDWFAFEYTKGNSGKAIEVLDMISTYQNAKGGELHSERVEAEVLYNRLNIFKWGGMGYMGAGLLLLILLIVRVLKPSKAISICCRVLIGLSLALFVWQILGLGLRWYISERAPWTNAYESMVYVSWATALAGVLFLRRSVVSFALSIFLAGVLLFVSNLSWMDPAITPLVPVLNSYWLIVHVAVITASYGFFGIGFLLGLTSLILMSIKGNEALALKIKELTVINNLALMLGLVLMTAGTFLGAVWANESWGRYWGWDPKETWALVTVVVYAILLHIHFVKSLRSPYVFAVGSVLALGSVLMTFFGVNYYLSGMHSYGADSAPPALSAIFWVYGVAAVIAIYAYFTLSRAKSALLTSNPQR